MREKKKKIAIIGGGVVGLVSAYYLSSKFEVTVYEKNKDLGGLASTIKAPGWEWSIERNYHHIFKNDHDFISFCHEIGFEDNLFFKTPKTSSLYNPRERTYQLDNPIDLALFPRLDFLSKFRAGLIILALKALPHLKFWDGSRGEALFQKLMGKDAWFSLFQQLFQKKFGKYAEIISASFFWSRIKSRTRDLGYINKSFDNFFNYLSKKNLADRGVSFKIGVEVGEVLPHGDQYQVGSQKYDLVLLTVPTPTILKIATQTAPLIQLEKMRKIKHIHSICLIVESKKPYFEYDYWVNVLDPEAPFMVGVQHTNFIDKQYYSNNHIAYFGQYTSDEKLLKLTAQQLYKYYKPYLNQIAPLLKEDEIVNLYVSKDYYSQPIFEVNFASLLPDYELVSNKLYMANLDMTYPHDRGVNHAVRVAREVSSLILCK